MLGGLAVSLAMLGAVVWVLRSFWRRSEDRKALAVRWVLTLGNLAFLGFVIGPMVSGDGGGSLLGSMATALFAGAVLGLSALVMGIVWSPSISEAVAKRFSRLYDGGDTAPDPEPLLSIAEARRKQGRFDEAEQEVQRQLERFPGNFRAQMFLAEIQAVDRHDLAATTQTIEGLLGQPGHTPKNLAFALTRLAEWQLRLQDDREAARATLERIIQLFPETPEAHTARQRIAHLTPPEMLAQARDRPKLAVPHSDERLGLRGEMPRIKRAGSDPQEAAEKLVAQLDAYPDDNQAREELALLYLEAFQRPDLALEQLGELIAQPLAPSAQVVKWLNLLADVHVAGAGDIVRAREAVQGIVDRYPGSPAAENARRRLALLERELQAKKQSQVLRLGSYEQRLGLKGKG